ncbi:MAG: exonuclease domain-containing protein, partial [Bacilli bacterium]|nr:exonuclease domain-containing protein [Bacilli bacterium]
KKALRGRKTLVFMDLEGTQFSHEMIEIGAYKVVLRDDLTIKKVFPGFKSYVFPKARIGKLVTDLTGITEEMIDKEGKPYRVVQQSFRKYVGKDFEKALFVTFGSHDYVIINASAENNMDASMDQARFVTHHAFDFAQWLAGFVRDQNGNNYSLANYLKIFGLPFEGKAHDALVDARNLVDLYKAVLAHPEVLKENYKELVARKNGHLPEPVRKVMQALQEGKTITPEDYDGFVEDYLR